MRYLSEICWTFLGFLDINQNNYEILHVCQSVSWLTSFLKSDQHRDIYSIVWLYFWIFLETFFGCLYTIDFVNYFYVSHSIIWLTFWLRLWLEPDAGYQMRGTSLTHAETWKNLVILMLGPPNLACSIYRPSLTFLSTSQYKARKLVCMHTKFLCAQFYISGCIHVRTLKLGMRHL